MVEPLSLALISGAAGLGMVVGKWYKSDDSENKYQETIPFEIKKESIFPKLHFLKVEDMVDTSEIIEIVSMHNQVFVNVRKLLVSPDKFYKFLHKLNNDITRNNFILHQISKDLLLITSKSQEIQVKTLKKLANKTDENDDLLPKEIAGY